MGTAGRQAVAPTDRPDRPQLRVHEHRQALRAERAASLTGQADASQPREAAHGQGVAYARPAGSKACDM